VALSGIENAVQIPAQGAWGFVRHLLGHVDLDVVRAKEALPLEPEQSRVVDSFAVPAREAIQEVSIQLNEGKGICHADNIASRIKVSRSALLELNQA